MPFDFTADTDTMILTGAQQAWQGGSSPTGSRYLYGTAALGQDDYGIIVNGTIKTKGDKVQVKGAGGATLARGIVDPGWEGNFSILFPVDAPRPKQGYPLSVLIPDDTDGALAGVLLIIQDFSIKWEQSGWRMLDIEAIHDKAMLASGVFWSYNVEQDGSLGTSIAVWD